MAIIAQPEAALGNLLRGYRERRGLSQAELAERAVPPLSPETVSNLERGRTRPYRHTLQALCRALELDDAANASVWAAREALLSRNALAESGNQLPGNLPFPATRLIGRENELAELTRHLRDRESRLLTLVGTGGVGKTRLALEVAHDLATVYPNGVWLIELGAMTDPALISQRVATELGMHETPDEPLTRALRQRRMLLVLDNCEHLLDACAALLAEILRTCPEVRVLATSREPVGIDGEVVWRVPSLSLPDPRLTAKLHELVDNPCVRLFLERATAVQPRFALKPRNAPAVVQICRRLDGIPLALELAAARVDSLTAEQVAVRLDQRFRLLTVGRRSALPRQQTLAATLDWSYDLLGEPEQRLFESLAVFSGGWTLAAAEAVCADQRLPFEDVLDLLAGLVRKSLVVAEETTDGGERYVLLETLRAYARRKLVTRDETLLASLRRRHADFYSELADRLDPRPPAAQRRLMWGNWFENVLGTTPPAEQLGRVQVEYENIRLGLGWWLETDRAEAGLRLARVVDGYWMSRGLYGEARAWIVRLLDLDQLEPHAADAACVSQELRAGALHALGLYASRQGDYAQARERLEASIALSRALGDELMVAATLSTLGLVLWLEGRPDLASALLQESQRILDRSIVGDDETHGWTAMTLRNLGLVARSQGDYACAVDLFGQSVALVRSFGVGGYALARGLGHLGRAEYLRGDRTQSRVHLGDALRILGADGIAGHTLGDCLDWVAATADPIPAARLFGAAAAQWQASGALRYAPDRSAHERDLARVHAQLCTQTFIAAWTEGEAMTAADALALALHELDRA